MLIVIVAIAALEAVDFLRAKDLRQPPAVRFPPYARWAGYYALALLIWVAAPLGSTQFIYFQF